MNTTYISTEELEPGCFRLKINYEEIEKLGPDSTTTSSEIVSGKVRWSLQYSSVWSFKLINFLEYANVEIVITTFNNHKKCFEFSLFDKTGKTVMTVSHGPSVQYIPLHISKNFLEDVAVVDGYFFVQCKIFRPKICSEDVSSLPMQLGHLLKSGEGQDVTIEVKGELFGAHKLILGARSPVFKAQLFGSMAEAKLSFIKIEDMEIEVFRCLLHYLYTDTLEDKNGTISINMAQHLLVAADRYGIDGLKSKCEEKVCKSISLDSVLSSLALAEQHNCRKLKRTCLKFVTKPTNLTKLVFTKEYSRFMKNFPHLVALLRKYTKRQKALK